MPLVSVVVTTKNEAKNIANCLNSVKAQSFKDVEIIVVDNASTDQTKEIAAGFTEHVYNLGPERSAQRNFGVAKACGTYVLYLDADMILSPTVIAECVTTMESDPKVSGLYVPETIMGEGFWISVRNFERSFYDGTVIDAVRFLRRETFQKLGGFDSSLCGPEDWDFDKRVRRQGRVRVIKAHLQHNESDFAFGKYLAKKSYYSQSMDAYIQKWGADDPDVRKQLGFTYRFLMVYLENGRFWRLLRHPVRAVGMYVLRFCVGVSYLRARKSK